MAEGRGGVTQPQTLAKKIDAFLSSDLAKRFTATGRAKMRQLQKAMGLVSDQTLRGTSSNVRPRTSTSLASITDGKGGDMIKNHELPMLGLGTHGIPGAIAGEVAQQGVRVLNNSRKAKRTDQLFSGLPDYVAPPTSYKVPMSGPALGSAISSIRGCCGKPSPCA